MKLGVVIVTYNRIKLLKECINACMQQTYKFSSIIIVNNCSTDGTSDYLQSLKSSIYTIINLDKNLGGAGGFYEGIKKAIELDNIDYLLIIDDDAIVEKNFNKEIYKAIENAKKSKEKILAYSGVVMTGGIILTSTRKNIDKKYKFIKCDLSLYKKDYFDYQISSFCGLFVSMDLVKKVGLPQKDFFIWYDDTEYSLRINKYTMIRNVNKAIIDHRAPVIDNNGAVTWKSYYGIRNRLYIEKKYFPKTIYIKNVIKNILISIKGYLKYILTRSEKSKYRSKLYFCATIDFLKGRYGFNEKIGFKTIE